MPFDLTRHLHLLRRHYAWLVALGVLALAGVYGLSACATSMRTSNAIDHQRQATAKLVNQIDQVVFDTMPKSLESIVGLAAVRRAAASQDAESLQIVEDTLETIRSAVGAAHIYVMDSTGKVIVSACAPEETRLLGNNYAFRPYFQMAMDGKPNLYLALGVTTKKRGVYFASPVSASSDGPPAAVAVIKSNLDTVDELFEAMDYPAMLLSPDGVVLATNQSGWLYRTIAPLDEGVHLRLSNERQFAAQPLERLPVSLAGSFAERNGQQEYMVESNLLLAGWRVATLNTDYESAPLTALQRILLLAAGCGGLLILITVPLLHFGNLERSAAFAELESLRQTPSGGASPGAGHDSEPSTSPNSDDSGEEPKSLLDNWRRNYDVLFQNTGTACAIIGNDSIFTAVNREFEKLVGLPCSEVEGKRSWQSFVHSDDLERMRGYRRLRFNAPPDAAPYAYEFRMVSASGEVHPIHMSVTEFGEAGSCIISMIDISAMRKAEGDLRASELRMESLCQSLFDVYYRVDDQGIIQEVGSVAEHIAGYSPKDLIGKPATSIYVDPQERLELVEKIRRYGRVREHLIRVKATDGRILFCALNASVSTDSEGKADGYIGMLRDVTERVRSMEELQKGAAQAQRTNIELQAQRVQLENRQRELLASNRALEEANRRIEVVGRRRASFLTKLSDAIRTPLNTILGYAESLSDKVLPDEERHHAHEAIRRNGRQLLEVVNDILDLGQMDSKGFTPVDETTDLLELLNEASYAAGTMATHKGLDFHCIMAPDLPQYIRSDASRLRQALMKLLDNAVRYTTAGYVTMEAQRVAGHPDQLQVDIIDSGAGIPQSIIQRIFDFESEQLRVEAAEMPCGLGLAVSSRTLVVLGGALEVVRSVPDGGTHLRIRLDIRLPAAHSLPRKAAEILTPDCLEGCRILVAEDDADTQRLLAYVLQRHGAIVAFSNNGRDAVQALTSQDAEAFDVVLMDVHMPVMDGHAAASAIRDAGNPIPIIALTAYTSPGHRRRSMEAGCNDFLAKPVERSQLCSAVRRWWKTKLSPARHPSDTEEAEALVPLGSM